MSDDIFNSGSFAKKVIKEKIRFKGEEKEMKGIKKLLIGILAAAMAMSITLSVGNSMTVMAANSTEHTITITNSDQVVTHTYQAYQVFAGDYDATSGALANVEWGTGVDSENFLAALKRSQSFGENNIFASATTAADVAKAMEGIQNDSTMAQAFAAVVGNHLTETVAGESTFSAENKSYSISVTGDGYYLMKDRDDTVSDATDSVKPDGTNALNGDSATRYMLQVVGNVNVAAKDATVESKKKVDDKNDSNNDESLNATLIDSADYDIGDIIPYTLTATLPSNYNSYSTYKLVFVDDMSAGLTLNPDSVKIYYGANDTNGTAIQFTSSETSSYTDGTLYNYTIEDLKTTKPELNSSDVIKITYTATLNEKAVIGAAGNPNKYYIQYSNNPNGNGTGKTPDDTNIVFTYKIVVNKVHKVNNQDVALTGANFTLYKEVSSDTTGAQTGEAIKNVLHNGTSNQSGNTSIKADALGDEKHYIVVDNKTGDATGSTFEFKGVDDGNYVLVETTIPAGYNAWESKAFTITATHETSSDSPKLTNLTGGELFGKNDDGTAMDYSATGVLTTSIENTSGAILPSTGGIGTTIFYIVGGILIIAGVAYFIVRRKANSN